MSTPDKDRVNRLVLELLAENPGLRPEDVFINLPEQPPTRPVRA